MLQVAIEALVRGFMLQIQDRLLHDGRSAVVRNENQPERELRKGVGPVMIKLAKARSRHGEPMTFRSARVPLYIRKTKSLQAALLWLYLKGGATGKMSETLEVCWLAPNQRGCQPVR